MRLSLKQQAYRKMLLKQIHLSPRYINYYKSEREEWQEFLEAHFGVKSSAALSIDSLQELNRYVHFKSDSLHVKVESPTNATSVQCKKIRELWRTYANDTSDEALLNWIGKKMKIYALQVEHLKRADIGRIIGVLKGFSK